MPNIRRLRSSLLRRRDAAIQDWWLRYFYEGPGGPGLVAPYQAIRSVAVGPIEPGTRRRIGLTIPDRFDTNPMP